MLCLCLVLWCGVDCCSVCVVVFGIVFVVCLLCVVCVWCCDCIGVGLVMFSFVV